MVLVNIFRSQNYGYGSCSTLPMCFNDRFLFLTYGMLHCLQPTVKQMLTVELRPAVRQIVERNEQLEGENVQLYEKVRELLTENTALKAGRLQFRRQCESLVSGQASQLLSPTKELEGRVQKQKRQIERLQQRLAATQSEAELAQRESRELEDRLEAHVGELEKSAQAEVESARACAQLVKECEAIVEICGAHEWDEAVECPEEIGGAIECLHGVVRLVSEGCAAVVQRREQATVENNSFKQMVTEMETRIRVLETEKNATEECNKKYEKEREELGGAIATLRKALDDVKTNLIAAEDEKKGLKEENVRLRIEIGQLREKLALAELS